MSLEPKKLAILVAGGPAPGINSVISAATIRAILSGTPVIGILDGFKYLMRGDISHTVQLSIEDVSRIHFRGGSFLGIARDNPTKDPKHLETTVNSLLRLNVTKLITIGGDDTAFSAYNLEKIADGRIKVVHVPKTIDNDLDLPHGIPTFGFQTARHVGVGIVQNIMTDARTTSRWYFVISMGRKAGHLALAIGKATGATLTVIPEEFESEKISLKQVVDILVGAIIKRLSYGRQDGVAVLAEGLVEHMNPEELSELVHIEKDDHDNIRLAEVNFGEILKVHVQKKLGEYGIKSTIVAKNIGYELRCADPIPFDMEYCRDLGFMASKFLQEGGSAALISMQNGHFVPMYFKDILDKKTGRMKIRMVNQQSESYEVARQYMIRLSKDDFNDPHELAKYAATSNMSLEKFREKFEYLVEKIPQHVDGIDGKLAELDADEMPKKKKK